MSRFDSREPRRFPDDGRPGRGYEGSRGARKEPARGDESSIRGSFGPKRGSRTESQTDKDAAIANKVQEMLKAKKALIEVPILSASTYSYNIPDESLT